MGEPKTYHVRFEDGPRDATRTLVFALESGDPPEILLTPDRPDWVYVRAGGPRADGSLPYLYMPRTKLARPRGISAN